MPRLPAYEDELAAGLTRLAARASYAEVMAEATGGHTLRFDRSATTPEPQGEFAGAVYRAWTGEGWVEAAVSGLRPTAIRATVDLLLPRLATATPRPPPGPSASGSLERSSPQRKPVADLGVEARIELAKTWFGWATAVPGIANAIVNISHLEDERLFLSTAGARRLQSIVRSRGTVVPLAIENGKVEYDFLTAGAMGGMEILDGFTEARVRASAEAAKRLLTARSPPTGRMPVVLDPSTSGTFAHESFGHGTEADQLLRDRSYLKPLLGEVVGPESVTLVDDGSFERGWGSIYFDDEGQEARRTTLVDHGRFVEVLHDRESAEAMHRAPTGNARRADFLSRSFVRMTNTFVEPGDWAFEELLREAKTGVLLETCTSGIEDPLGGNMQIKVKKARLIEGGEPGAVVSSMALSGKVLEFLRSIRGVSRAADFEMAPGFCGKGHTDLLPAGTGGPYLLAEAVVGPA